MLWQLIGNDSKPHRSVQYIHTLYVFVYINLVGLHQIKLWYVISEINGKIIRKLLNACITTLMQYSHTLYACQSHLGCAVPI